MTNLPTFPHTTGLPKTDAQEVNIFCTVYQQYNLHLQ